MSALAEIQEAVARVAAGAGRSVVAVGRRASGIVVEPGAVLTVAHAVGDEPMTVAFIDGRTAEATVTGTDHDRDLAVLSVDTGDAPPLAFAAAQVEIGAAVVAASSAGGRQRVTLGFVSGAARSFRGPRGRRVPGGIEHTARLGFGSSGSALLDVEGRLLGINARRMRDGFSLAVPADAELLDAVEALRRGESRQAVRLGVGIAPPRLARRLRQSVGLPERDGLLVRLVEDGTPAERAGIAPGDLIVASASRPLRGVDDLQDELTRAGAGGAVQLTVVRGVEERRLDVALSGAEA